MLASGEQIGEELRRRGLRATRARIAVYAAVAALPGHPDVRQVMAQIEAAGERVSTQATYDCLQALTLAGLLRRIDLGGSAARYETRVGDNHHHLVCRGCGATRDVGCAVGEAPCLSPDDTGGFAVAEAEITFWGICPECRRDERAEDAAAALAAPSATRKRTRPAANLQEITNQTHAEGARTR